MSFNKDDWNHLSIWQAWVLLRITKPWFSRAPWFIIFLVKQANIFFCIFGLANNAWIIFIWNVWWKWSGILGSKIRVWNLHYSCNSFLKLAHLWWHTKEFGVHLIPTMCEYHAPSSYKPKLLWKITRQKNFQVILTHNEPWYRHILTDLDFLPNKTSTIQFSHGEYILGCLVIDNIAAYNSTRLLSTCLVS